MSGIYLSEVDAVQ